MPAMTNVLVKDDAATPKEWTFIPVTDADGEPVWRTDDPGIPIEGQLRITGSCTKVKSGDYKMTAKLEVPVMETLGASGTSAGYVASQSVAHTVTGIFTMFASRRSTKAERANTLKLMMGILQGASSVTATGILTNTAAGDAWKNSVSPFPALFTSMLVPN